MADSYVIISLLIVTMLELLVLQILHVSTLNLSDRLAPAHTSHSCLGLAHPSAHMASLLLSLRGSNAIKPSGR